MNTQLTFPRRTGLIVLIACSLTVAAQAQSIRNTGPVAPFASLVPENPSGTLTGLDFGALDAADWKNLSKEQTRLLDASDEQIREEAMQNIIFFTTHYGGDVNFKRATSRLYTIYRFDRNEAHRIMALAAIHVIGRENTMRLLNQHVRWETSARVRRLTQAALVDFYGHETPPVPSRQINR